METRWAIIVSSCDYFKDCWAPFIYSLKKYWPDNESPVYIISNQDEIADDAVRFIKVGQDRGWASNLKIAISKVDADYVLYLQEDYWLVDKVCNEKILSQFDYCMQNNLDMLRLSYPYYDNYAIDELHAKSPIDKEKYALCLQPSIWKKETLKEALIEGWSGWDYEAKVNELFIRKNKGVRSEVILSTSDEGYRLRYVGGTAVRKGRWTQDAVRFLKANGFSDLVKRREVEGKCLVWLTELRDYKLLKYPATALIRMMNKLNLNF